MSKAYFGPVFIGDRSRRSWRADALRLVETPVSSPRRVRARSERSEPETPSPVARPKRAEVRAFYSGCFGTLAYVCGRCVPAGQTTERRRDALNAVGCLLALFSLARVYSYAVDGPPGRGNVYALWALEALGATAALCLSLVESICSSAVDGVAAAGAVLLGGRKGE